MSSHKISLPAAVLINLNIIVGSGIFINTVLLAKLAGQYGAITYLIVGMSIFPLLLSFSQLALIHRGGSLYTYVATQSSYNALISTCSYFLAKLASCAVAVHVCASLLQTVFPLLQQLPVLALDTSIIVLFTLLNILEGHIGKRIQIIFLAGKLIPIATVLVMGCITFLASPALATGAHVPIEWNGIMSGIPFVLYAFMGFEASSALSRSLKNPERNGALAIFIAYIFGLAITTLFQFFFTLLVPNLGALKTYLEAFPLLLSTFGLAPSIKNFFVTILHSGIAASAAGVAFGILYTNCWNLYELVERGHARRTMTWLGTLRHQIPYYCILIEGAIVWLFLLCTQGHITVLQQISACGVIVTYLLSTTALFLYESGRKRIVPFFGILSCILLLASCVRNFLILSMTPFIIFALLMSASMLIFHHTPHVKNSIEP